MGKQVAVDSEKLIKLIEEWDRLAKTNMAYNRAHAGGPGNVERSMTAAAYEHCVITASELIGRDHGYEDR